MSIPSTLSVPGVRTRNTFAYPQINDLGVLFLVRSQHALVDLALAQGIRHVVIGADLDA